MAAQAVTDQSFDGDVLKSNTPVLLDFWAEWCGPCRALGPKLEEIAKELGNQIRVLKINIDENPATPSKFGIRSIPTMILFKGGQPVDQLLGNLPKEHIIEMLRKHI